MPGKIIFIVGPTAVGKSAVAVRLAKAIGGEVISCDSMQVYKEAAVVTGKPGVREQQGIRHYLVDAVSVKDDFDVAQFNVRARRAIAAIMRKKKTPVIVGGSGLYVKVLLDGIFEEGPKQDGLREALKQKLARDGVEALYQRLQEIDPVAARGMHPRDSRRILRALEVHAHSGKKISDLQQQGSGIWGKYDISVIGLTMDRASLYERINARIDAMFDQGAAQEIDKVRRMPLGRSARQLIGLKEIGGYLSGEYSLEQAKYLMKRNTRHFAKRQMTWFRKEKRVQWLEVTPGQTEDKIVKSILKLAGL